MFGVIQVAAYSREFSRSLSSSRYPNSKSQNLEDSDHEECEIMIINQPLNCLLDNNHHVVM